MNENVREKQTGQGAYMLTTFCSGLEPNRWLKVINYNSRILEEEAGKKKKNSEIQKVLTRLVEAWHGGLLKITWRSGPERKLSFVI